MVDYQAIIKELEPQILQAIKSSFDRQVDEIKKGIVDKAKEGVKDFYAVPEGKYYSRTMTFDFWPYETIDERDYSSLKNLKAVVGVNFNTEPHYYNAGISDADIYDWNIQGIHPRSNFTIIESTDIIQSVDDYIGLISI